MDVGYGQLAWKLQQDDRVVVHDRTNVREITPELVGGQVDLVVGDLSFISLALVLDALTGVTRPDGDLALMVKPQFEVGKERVGKGGVVRDLDLRAEAVARRRRRSGPPGLGRPRGSRPVSCPGPSGNVEFFLWLRHGPATLTIDDIHTDVSVPSRPWGRRVRGWTRDDDQRTPDPARADHRPHRTRRGPRGGPRLRQGPGRATGSWSGCSPARPATSDLGGGGDSVEIAEVSGASADCELVLVIGGDGIDPACRRAHPRHLDPGARGQPRPRRLPRRGGVRRRRVDHRRDRPPALHHRGPAHPRRDRPRRRRGGHQHLRAQRGQRREGGPRADARGGRRDRRPTTVAVGLRRGRLRDADRVHGLQLQRRRTGGLAGRRGAADGADQRARTLRPPARGRAHLRPGRRGAGAHRRCRRAVVRRPSHASTCPRVPGSRCAAATTPVRLVRLHEAPFTDRLVAKFGLPVEGWRGSTERRRKLAEGHDV